MEMYTLYHGTNSKNIVGITTKKSKLYLTTDEDVAEYYALKGGEDYFLGVEIKFENKYGISPYEYYDVEENGEIGMFKELYPKNAKPIVITYEIPARLISDIKSFYGYKGKSLTVLPEYISNIKELNFDDYDF